MSIRETEVNRERLRVLCSQVPAAGVATIFVGGGTAGMLVATLGGAAPLVWFGALCATVVLRLVMYLTIRRRIDRVGSPIAAMRVLAMGSTTTALCWGLLIPIFGDDQHPEVIVICVLADFGILTGTIGSLGAYLPALVSFLVLVIIPASAWFLMVGGAFAWAVAPMALAFVLASLSFARISHRTLVEAIRLRFANEQLVVRVTEEKDRALAAQRSAERANRAKAQFLAAASHDLRQPLHAQALFVGALASHAGDERVRYLASRIAATGTALNTLLDGLLDISKLDANAVRPEHRTFRLQRIFDQLDTEFVVSANEKQLQLRIVPTEASVYGDPTIIERIARNLVSNAVRYTPSGGRVVVACRPGNPLRLVVADNGIGIAAEDQARIFEEFVQIHNPERDRSKGIGLGLAIVQRLGALIGSKISVSSKLGRGAMFTVTLVPGDTHALTEPRSDLAPTTSLVGTRVLVIDDEEPVRAAFDEILTSWQCIAVCVASGDEAARAAREITPDLVIADHRLRHHETGHDAIAKVFEVVGAELPALLVTGDTDPLRIREAQSYGVPLIHKPVSAEKLRTLIERSLPPMTRSSHQHG